jgi:hypothetical protein
MSGMVSGPVDAGEFGSLNRVCLLASMRVYAMCGARGRVNECGTKAIGKAQCRYSRAARTVGVVV